jgi:SAM-dependent methyltransferase
VGAGHECVLYYLANRTRLTVATDLYGGAFAGSIAAEADPAFLSDPGAFAPFPYRRDHLVGLPADGLALPFVSESFDVVYSLSSIEHFGGHDKAAESVREMARVLRPGGVACVATEFIMEGGQHGEYFTADDLHHWILAASPELELVEPIDFTPPDRRYFDDPVHLPDDPLHTPHVVLAIDGWRFTSIVLFFAKRRPGPPGLRSRARRLLGA